MFPQSAIFSIAAAGVIALNTLTSAAPYPVPQYTPPPPGENYTTGYPICGVAGFTNTPGNYTETTHQMSNSTLRKCINECRDTSRSVCGSIAFADVYGECLWYNMKAEDTQLIANPESYFVHYDVSCWVG